MLWFGVASALAGLGPHSSREPLPSRELERASIVPKGWTEIEFDLEHARADAAWSAEGDPLPLAVIRSSWTASAGLRVGIAPGWEVFANLPWHRVDAFVVQQGVGTVEVGTRVSVVREEAPNRSVVMEFAARLPLGADGPIGSIDDVRAGPDGGRLPLTVGTGDLVLAALGRRAFGPMLVDGRLEVVRRFAGRPAWHGGRFEPGDTAGASARVLLQVGPTAWGPTGELVGSGPVRSAGPGDPLIPVRGTGGARADAGGEVLLQLTRGLELQGSYERSLIGEDDAFAWVPSVHPLRERRLAFTVRGRL